MRFAPILLCLILSIFSFPAYAEDCANAASQAEINECAIAGLKNTDTELNKVYREIIERLKDSAETKQLLVASQRVWLQWRDAECAFAASAAKGGSVYPSVVSGCRTAMTADRVKGLGVYLKCQEGDMGCPVPAK